jgi:hypothetical protein
MDAKSDTELWQLFKRVIGNTAIQTMLGTVIFLQDRFI